MKNVLIAGVMLVTSLTFAQEVKPKLEVVDQMVKATYYYENGQVKQEGYYLDGKLHGKWVAFNEDGTKQSMGEYNKGAKSGKWFFWSDASLSEVDFSDSRIAEVKKWSKDVLVKN
ncbi:membrane-binding protein [Flavobacterium sp. HXWNR29]|uniref:toxin-antitoxin system YwqK family antitoxin n=1 Tax=Flavobacterium odoriferum TaxID=2946604 RepID=UPI0021CB38FA|nr:membrane-binding protein [Flavobacterium sp. HXWNR29]MCU4187731.1 membrane-binding protein [Flavobacterium sp. HXWNR29]